MHPARRTRIASPLLASSLLVALAAAGCSAPLESPAGTTAAAATAFANDKAAYDYFAGKGLANFQAAGIVGNLDQESGVDPNAVQAGGPGRGIAQWSVGGRWDTAQGDNLVAYAAQQGASATSLALQLDFIWFELETFPSYGLAKLKATTSVTDATVAFETDFEGCGACDESTRVAYAKDVLAAYGNDPVDAGSAHDAAAPDAAPRDAGDAGATPPEDDSGPVGATQDGGATNDGGARLALSEGDGSSGCAMGRRAAERRGDGAEGGAMLVVIAIAGAWARRRREPRAHRSARARFQSPEIARGAPSGHGRERQIESIVPARS